LKTLIDLFTIIDGAGVTSSKIGLLPNDLDGTETVRLLKKNFKVASRISGDSHGSLGLHPAVYFYTERGKHSRFLFLGTVKAVARAVTDNDKEWFKKFTRSRGKIEKLLIERKSLINQGLANVNSSQRVERITAISRFVWVAWFPVICLWHKMLCGRVTLASG